MLTESTDSFRGIEMKVTRTITKAHKGDIKY
jgi:hypothetical protein